MIPKIIKKGAIAPLKPTVLSPENKLVVVYNSRLDPSEIVMTDIAKDWSLFMDDLSTKMFDKISL
jgi:hypothetical protein